MLFVRIVYAGSLTPSASPAATSYTLTDIYNRLTTNAAATMADHDFVPVGPPAGSLHTLAQIYDAIPTIDPTTVVVGTTYLGIDGSLAGEMFNGTLSTGGFPGGTQENGGTDDLNNNEEISTDRYECPAGWTQCTAGNNYCGTGLASADAKDECTQLIWSFRCNGSGCLTFSENESVTYSWSNGANNNTGMTAPELCSEGDHGESGWSLPHQK